MVFQNRKDNFEEVYFLNGNIYPLSTLGWKKKKRVSAVGPENHLENILKGLYSVFTIACFCICVNAHVYICMYMCTLNKSSKIKVGRTKFHKPNEIESSNFILDKSTFFEPVWSYEAKQEQTGQAVMEAEFLLQRLFWKGCAGRGPRCSCVYTNQDLYLIQLCCVPW